LVDVHGDVEGESFSLLLLSFRGGCLRTFLFGRITVTKGRLRLQPLAEGDLIGTPLRSVYLVEGGLCLLRLSFNGSLEPLVLKVQWVGFPL